MKQALIILGALVLVSGGGFFLLTGPGIMGMNGAIDDAKIAPGGNPVNANVAGDPAVGKVEAVAAAQA